MKISKLCIGVITLCVSQLGLAYEVRDLENEPKVPLNSLSVNDASNSCLNVLWQSEDKMGNKFGFVGHAETVYVIASLAGQNLKNIHELTYFAQYPDQMKELDAINNAIKNKIPFDNDKFTHDIVTKLHSLHGGDSKKIKMRRSEVENAIKNNLNNSNNIWKAGLLIHSLGDTYAHTYNQFNTDKEVAYGPATGHLFDSFFGHDPDAITPTKTKIKYLAYIDDLFDLLKTDDANTNRFNELKSKVETTTCTTDYCFGKYVLNYHNKMYRYSYCMDKYMTPLTKPQVQGVMDQIKD